MAGRVIVVTGASGGIGAAVAVHQAGQGDRLVLAARREPELERVAEQVRAAGGEAVSVGADVTRRADVERIRVRALDTFGQVDVWINNAGQGITKNVLDVTDEDFDAIMAVNVKSALYGMQAIVPHFKQRGVGQVINVSSFLGRVPMASFRSVYSAAKAALNSLSANLRMDLRREYPRIYVSVLMPGIVMTDFRTNARGGTPDFNWGGVTAAAGKPQTAEDVAVAMANLIDNPVAEMFTNPMSSDIARRYYADVGRFEEEMLR